MGIGLIARRVAHLGAGAKDGGHPRQGLGAANAVVGGQGENIKRTRLVIQGGDKTPRRIMGTDIGSYGGQRTLGPYAIGVQLGRWFAIGIGQGELS